MKTSILEGSLTIHKSTHDRIEWDWKFVGWLLKIDIENVDKMSVNFVSFEPETIVFTLKSPVKIILYNHDHCVLEEHLEVSKNHQSANPNSKMVDGNLTSINKNSTTRDPDNLQIIFVDKLFFTKIATPPPLDPSSNRSFPQ